MQLEAAVQQFLAGYFSTCRRTDKTRTAYKTDLAQFRAHAPECQGLEDVEAGCLEHWAQDLVTNRYAPASIRRKFATLRVFFNYWVRKGGLAASPLWKVRLDLDREYRLPRTLTATDAKRLLERAWLGVSMTDQALAKPSNRQFRQLRNLVALEILFATGMRVGELVTLSLPDWREDEAIFLVQGKGARQRLAVLPDKRSIEVVRNYISQRSKLQLSHGALLVNSFGGPLSTQGVARVLSRLATEAGIDRKVTPHMIRHTVATLLLRNGADIRVVQEVLGHASIVMTQRYTHVSKEHLRHTLELHHPNHHFSINPATPGGRAGAVAAGFVPA